MESRPLHDSGMERERVCFIVYLFRFVYYYENPFFNFTFFINSPLNDFNFKNSKKIYKIQEFIIKIF